MDLHLLTTTTAWGAIAAVPYCMLKAWRHKEFDAGKAVIVFCRSVAPFLCPHVERGAP